MPARELPALILAVPPPMGLKGEGTLREATLMCMHLEVARSNGKKQKLRCTGGEVVFADVMDALVNASFAAKEIEVEVVDPTLAKLTPRVTAFTDSPTTPTSGRHTARRGLKSGLLAQSIVQPNRFALSSAERDYFEHSVAFVMVLQLLKDAYGDRYRAWIERARRQLERLKSIDLEGGSPTSTSSSASRTSDREKGAAAALAAALPGRLLPGHEKSDLERSDRAKCASALLATGSADAIEIRVAIASLEDRERARRAVPMLPAVAIQSAAAREVEVEGTGAGAAGSSSAACNQQGAHAPAAGAPPQTKAHAPAAGATPPQTKAHAPAGARIRACAPTAAGGLRVNSARPSRDGDPLLPLGSFGSAAGLSVRDRRASNSRRPPTSGAGVPAPTQAVYASSLRETVYASNVSTRGASPHRDGASAGAMGRPVSVGEQLEAARRERAPDSRRSPSPFGTDKRPAASSGRPSSPGPGPGRSSAARRAPPPSLPLAVERPSPPAAAEGPPTSGSSGACARRPSPRPVARGPSEARAPAAR